MASALYHLSLEDLCQRQGEPYLLLAPGDPARERDVQTLDGFCRVRFRSTQMYCGRVHDVAIFGKSYVTDQAGRGVFFGQSHRDYLIDEFLAFYNTEIKNEARPGRVIPEECCFLGGSKPFGHYLFEYLSRLSAFAKVGLLRQLPVVLFDDVPERWLGFIELYGVPYERIIKIPRHPAPHFKSVWIARCPHAMNQAGEYCFWDEGIADLRARIVGTVARLWPDQKGPKRLYIGRKGAGHRLLLNELAVWNFLESRGFEWPDMGVLSAAEQVMAIASAELVVSVVGSGSPLTMFAPADATILEIRPVSIAGALGSLGFASVIGQTFTAIFAEVDPNDTKNQGTDRNLILDIHNLQGCVDKAIGSKRSA